MDIFDIILTVIFGAVMVVLFVLLVFVLSLFIKAWNEDKDKLFDRYDDYDERGFDF